MAVTIKTMIKRLDPIYFVALAILLITIAKKISIISLSFFSDYSQTILLLIILTSIIVVTILLTKYHKSFKSLFLSIDKDYLIAKAGSSELLIGGVSISSRGSSELNEVRADDYYRRFQSFISGLLKSGVSLTCITRISPPQGSEDSIPIVQLLVVSRRIGREAIDEAMKMLETDIEKIKSIYDTAFPELQVVRLSGRNLVKYLNHILIDDSLLKKHGIDELLNLLAPHVPNNLLPFLSQACSIEDSGKNDVVNLGSIVFNGSKIAPLRLELDRFKKHVAIYGSTGSGKTTTVKHILTELAGLGYPFLVLDWHNEYHHLAKELDGKVLRLGNFSLDILNPIELENLSEHVAMVTDIFDQIYNFTPSQSYMFREVLMQTLTEKELGIKEGDPLARFIETLEKWSIKSFYENETKFALLRRLRPLATGQCREIFCNRDKLIRIGDLVNGITVFELGDIVEVDMRKLTSLFILALLYEFRLKNRDTKFHFTVLEEAHNILPYRRRDSPPTIAEKLFLEMRKFNESLILVSQFPSQISPEIVKSTSLKISHRICEGEESRILIDIMGLPQADYDLLKRLPPGYGFLIVEDIPKPILLSVGFN
jgi:hypothetical protein